MCEFCCKCLYQPVGVVVATSNDVISADTTISNLINSVNSNQNLERGELRDDMIAADLAISNLINSVDSNQDLSFKQ